MRAACRFMKRAKHRSPQKQQKTKEKRLVISLTRSSRNFQRVSQTRRKERQETILSSERELRPASHLKHKTRDPSVEQLPRRRHGHAHALNEATARAMEASRGEKNRPASRFEPQVEGQRRERSPIGRL